MSITVNSLVKIYGTQKAVNEISFSINKGEVVGFLGPNGAGKSTTLRIITGYISPEAGSATVCGINVQENPLAVKKKIGYLPEANPLYYDMYVREYLSFVAGVHKIKNPKTRIEETIILTGLTVESRKKIGQLSKGYKQRTGLAAALVHDPEVLILDEPTSGLDPNQIIEIRNLIKEQGKKKTVLFSSHILQEVQAICNRIIIINKGEIVADDKLDALQKHTKDNIVKVSFRERPDISLLQKISYVTNVTSEDDYTWRLATTNSSETKKQLLGLALQENLNIVSLQTATGNLEEIFRTLTK